jgi:hypothetical protein
MIFSGCYLQLAIGAKRGKNAFAKSRGLDYCFRVSNKLNTTTTI